MIALDTNILVYAHRPGFPEHPRSREAIEALVKSRRRFAIPWPCVHEFMSVVTHPRRFASPTSTSEAVAFFADLQRLPNCRFLNEADDHLQRLDALMREAIVAGPRVHDARIAAICLSHGVEELWTADRDFSLFPALRVRNPCATGSPGVARY